MKVIECYLQEDSYNPRIQATVYGAWVAVLDDGSELAVCRPWEAKNAADARKQIEARL